MALSAYLFFKAIRGALAPAVAGFLFSILLTVIFVLYQPTKGPGERQKLGWQSWASVSPSVGVQSPTNDNPTTGGGAVDIPEGVDWWDVISTDQPVVDSSSLALDEWDPLQPHDTGSA